MTGCPASRLSKASQVFRIKQDPSIQIETAYEKISYIQCHRSDIQPYRHQPADIPFLFRWQKRTVQVDQNNLAIIASGNAELGKELAEEMECSGCHGDTGISEDGEFPNLAGQRPAYIVKQLHDYKSGARATDTMQDFTEELDMKKMADLAAFYAAQKPAEMAGDIAPKLAVETDKARFMIACDKCHGIKGIGRGFDAPRLAGQQLDYLQSTMEAFRDGERANDHYERMRFIAKTITKDEIKALVKYYAMKPEDDD